MQENISVKISILIPTFNRASYLHLCIKSFYNEIEKHNLFENTEVIISDNNSSDNTKNVVEEFAKEQNFKIRYFKNEENIGAVNNIIKLVSYASNDISLMFGDDDLVVPDSLPRIFNILNDHPHCEVYHFKCLQTNFIKKGMKPIQLTPFEAADKYFYNLGNFGVFAYRTKPAIMLAKNNAERLAGTCWPQTEIMFLIMLQSHVQKPFLVCGLETSNSFSHSENVVYTSWYLVETTGFSLMRVAQNISAEFGNKFSLHAKKSIPLILNFKSGLQNFLFFSMYIDYPDEVSKTAKLLKTNLLLLNPPFAKYINKYVRVFNLSVGIKKIIHFLMLMPRNPFRFFQVLNRSKEQLKNNRQKKKEDFEIKQANKTLTEKYLY